MNNIIKIIKKFLLSDRFFNDGFEYQFVSVVEGHLYNDIKIVVNVLLPKKGQSFVVEKFSYDISEIIRNVSLYVGKGISYSETILIEGKPIPKHGVYINDEDCDEIIRALNENVKNVEVSNNKDVSSVRCKISFSRNKEINNFYSMDSHHFIDFYLKYNISNFEFNDVPVNVNLKTIDEFAEVFNEKLQNSNRFRDKLQDIIYRVLEPSLQIEDLEVYYNAQYWMDKVDGIKVQPSGENLYQDFTEEMFTPTL